MYRSKWPMLVVVLVGILLGISRSAEASYAWTVEAIDRDGQTISASRAQPFQVVR